MLHTDADTHVFPLLFHWDKEKQANRRSTATLVIGEHVLREGWEAVHFWQASRRDVVAASVRTTVLCHWPYHLTVFTKLFVPVFSRCWTLKPAGHGLWKLPCNILESEPALKIMWSFTSTLQPCTQWWCHTIFGMKQVITARHIRKIEQAAPRHELFFTKHNIPFSYMEGPELKTCSGNSLQGSWSQMCFNFWIHIGSVEIYWQFIDNLGFPVIFCWKHKKCLLYLLILLFNSPSLTALILVLYCITFLFLKFGQILINTIK